MDYLFKEYDLYSKRNFISKELPRCIIDNLRPKFVLRPYQIEAFARFIYFYELDDAPDKQNRPYHILYNMATGSGKTNIMAGLILYLYGQGYRDFLFFVNSNNVIQKTKDNFLNPQSSKYVFNERIVFDTKEVLIKEVESFDESDAENINIKFTTIQKLHLDMDNPQENSISFEDFKERKIVLLADEADNFNVATRNDHAIDGNWENTIQSIHSQNHKNILLEFTATMDLDTPSIKEKYFDKTILKYDLKNFRLDRYSKEINILRVSSGTKNRILHALILNLYRQTLAATYAINLKPVILFKAKKTIAESEHNEQIFHKLIEELTESDVDTLRNTDGIDAVIKRAFSFFDSKGISSTDIVRRTKFNFRPENCISANNDAEKERNQMLLNSLEDENNPIRAVFAVNKLDRGWDVLNLFDIVRMYDERNEDRNGNIGKTTRAEAQLIGRGARYFPFKIDENQDLYMRKYDNDTANELRILETLYYHIIEDSRYVSEIKKALVEAGITEETSVHKTLYLKDSFKKTVFYKNAQVVYNLKIKKDHSGVKSLQDLSVRKTNYQYTLSQLDSKTTGAFDNNNTTTVFEYVDLRLKDMPYNVLRFALTTMPFFRFSNLKHYCPNLTSTEQFILDDNYLGGLEITFKAIGKERLTKITRYDLLLAIQGLLQSIENEIKTNDIEYEGSTYIHKYLHDVFGTKEITFPKDPEREEGQETMLADKEWYAFNANYGTSEERAFINLFARRYDYFTAKYEDIYVIRNEKVIKIIDSLGRTFEPDFLLYLRDKESHDLVYQIFIEPKGEHLKGKDKWKEDFLTELRSSNKTMRIETDEYHITGVPFYNLNNENEFKAELEQMLNV